MKLPTVSLHQPHASAVAFGFKPTETRDWAAPRKHWGSNIGIHATKTPINEMVLAYLIDEDPRMATIDWNRVPFGALVAVAYLFDCGEVIDHTDDGATAVLAIPDAIRPENETYVTCEIDPLGHYGIGRWIWRLGTIEKFDEPIPMRGYQRVWYADV